MKTFNEFVKEDIESAWLSVIEHIESNFGNIALERKPEVTSYNPTITTNPKHGESFDDFQARLKQEYDAIYNKLEEAKNEMLKILKSVGKHDATFLVNKHSIKSLDALADKIYNRGKRAEKITDVIRCAILARTEDDVKEIVRLINRNHHVYEYEFKEMGGDKKFGYYGSHHFLVKLSTNEFLAEIQVMTNRLWAFKEVGHQIYSKYRSGEIKDDFEKVQKDSKAIFAKGNIPIFRKY